MIGTILKPGEICRLLFSALDESSEPIADLVQADVSSVAWEYAVDGVWTAGASVTLVGSTASAKTTSKSIGQLVEWSPADGVYGVDCPAAAAVAGRVLRLVVVLTDGTAYAAEHVVSEAWSTHSAGDVADEVLATPANKLATGAAGEVTTDTASRNASKATGFSTHSAGDVLTAFGTGSTLTACATATGFATPANVTDAAAAVQLDATQPNYDVSTFDPSTDQVDIGYIEGTDATDYFDVILSDLATLKSRITATLFSGITSLGNWLRLITRSDFTNATATSEIAGTYDATTDSLQAIRDRGDAAWLEGSGGDSSGSGAYTVTVTVTDGTNPLQNATVRFTEGASTYTATTDVSGEAVFALDDATYAVAITKPGYSFTPTAMAVSEDASQSYAMTQISITPPVLPGTATVFGIVSLNGVIQGNVTVSARLESGPGISGQLLLDNVVCVTSSETGYVEFELLQNATYSVWIGDDTAKQITYTVPAQATIEIDEVIGTK